MEKPDPHVLVIFGAAGDLARRKLLPGIFHLYTAGLMPADFRLVGAARSPISDDEFRALAKQAIDEHGRAQAGDAQWDRFAERLSFASIAEGFGDLAGLVARSRDELSGDARVLHHLAVPPTATTQIVTAIGESKALSDRARLILEKPFGTDLDSARALNRCVGSVFDESQVFRIDHYLGREAVQNLLAIRFANGMFEPVWNSDHIDHIQIDVPETLSVGSRAGYYEGVGAFRDMVVTHLFHVLGFVALEPPTSLNADSLMTEERKVFESMPTLRPGCFVRGRYKGYGDTPGVDRDSDTETFVALRVFVDNWRWSGVPFYLRTGKCMAENRHLLTIAFKQPPRRMFAVDTRYAAESFGYDHLTFELGDPGSISATFQAKVPGPGLELGEADMDFSYVDAFDGPQQALDAYERLIRDVMLGNRMLFTTAAAIERLWQISMPVIDEPPPLQTYEQGSWGPSASDGLIAPRRWHDAGRHGRVPRESGKVGFTIVKP